MTQNGKEVIKKNENEYRKEINGRLYIVMEEGNENDKRSGQQHEGKEQPKKQDQRKKKKEQT